MRIPKLKQAGSCSICGRIFTGLVPQIEIIGPSVPTHQVNRKECRGSGISALNARLTIETSEEALKVAKFIKNDDDKCLGSFQYHSLACGDGRRCHDTRMSLAKALAEYYLTKVV